MCITYSHHFSCGHPQYPVTKPMESVDLCTAAIKRPRGQKNCKRVRQVIKSDSFCTDCLRRGHVSAGIGLNRSEKGRRGVGFWMQEDNEEEEEEGEGKGKCAVM